MTCRHDHLHRTRSPPYELAGDVKSFGGLSILPLFPERPPALEYVGLGEALARGLSVCEVDEAGSVETLLLENPLGERVLLYEGEELVGAKQNRILERTILVEARVKLEIPVACVEPGRWSYRSRRFEAAPRAAYPALRRAARAGQAAVWASVAAKQTRLRAPSPTEAAEQLYVSHAASLDEYVVALPRLDGQSGALVAIAGRVACIDYVGRSDVFAGLYPKLLRGYALDAIDAGAEGEFPAKAAARLLRSYFGLRRSRRRAIGLGVQHGLEGEHAVGSELTLGDELVALTLFPSKAA